MNFFRKYLLLLLLAGCEKSEEAGPPPPPPPEENEFVTYSIKAGEHFSTNTYQAVSGKKMSFEAIFDSSCIYTTESNQNAGDINKLYGFSDCNTHHQVNSARVGWLWNGNAIELYGYCYADSNRVSKLLGTAEINEVLKFSIAVSSSQYIFTYNDSAINITRHCTDSVFTGYKLYPYFGGDETAPHDMHIQIR